MIITIIVIVLIIEDQEQEIENVIKYITIKYEAVIKLFITAINYKIIKAR